MKHSSLEQKSYICAISSRCFGGMMTLLICLLQMGMGVTASGVFGYVFIGNVANTWKNWIVNIENLLRNAL